METTQEDGMREREERGVGPGPGDVCRRWGFCAGSEGRRSWSGHMAGGERSVVVGPGKGVVGR